MRFGREIVIRGEIEAQGDLSIEGRVEGRVRASQAVVVESGAEVEASIEALRVTVAGRVRGNVSAREAIKIEANAQVIGDLAAPEIAIADGAVLRGKIAMPVDLPEELR